jgi:ketosteroid isomerase-like protein
MLVVGAGRVGGATEVVVDARVLHRLVESGFDAGDVDTLVALYGPGAQMIDEQGVVARGHDAIRARWSEYVALGLRLSVVTRYAIESGDLALLSNSWTLELDGEPVASSFAAEVARRQGDGRWLYVIDSPYGASGEVR